ncbi:AsmA family protein [Paracrocinitomix mangrovi]|uniref:AsmA family protein n=1 Tax=Paracrocinitomix mangrovi TaxID=2862509 RepID=UPI001C8D91FC|nr:AsmA-like C-terminal region-containing protein [Paracrocinitomix mangrovi]UKN02091.1 AsmA family protein [Paracrocinitomix mangrovi]
MKFNFLKRRKFWKRLIIWLILAPILLFFTVVLIVYIKQDAIVQELISDLNEDFVGKIEIEDSHVSPFENFPYISIDLDNVKIYEDKDSNKDPIVEVEDLYVGFDIWTLLSGSYDIKLIELKKGFIHVVQDENGDLNLTKALSQQKEIEDASEEFHIHLKEIDLYDIDIYKYNEATGLMVEAFVDEATMSFQTNEEKIHAFVDSKMEMNVINSGDTSFFKHKHINTHLDIDYTKADEMLYINPSELELEHAKFNGEGMVDINDDFNVTLAIYGEKKNFDLFLAFAPEELEPVLARYENAGRIFFDAQISGPTLNGQIPFVYMTFGCEDAYFDNKVNHKKIDQLNFTGYFSNSGGNDLSNMEFALQDFTARPEAGTFKANLKVKNFESPNIEMSLDSDFDLDFLAKFINETSFENLSGKVNLHMKFHDIIDLSRPERSIEKMNEAYYSEINISNLAFRSSAFHLPLKKLDTKIIVEGNQAAIEHFDLAVGSSDLSIVGHISDLPAIIHHTDDKVISDLTIKSDTLNIRQLTKKDAKDEDFVDEVIDDLSMNFKFISSAKAFTESPNLPVGEFFIENLYAKLEHYPHTFHDFHCDFFIEDSSFKVIDFSGMIDKTDFHFNGKLLQYERWLQKHPKGDTEIEFDLTSSHLELKDLFSYKGENYVPEDYRHEELSNMKLHGDVLIHFNDGFKSADFYFDHVAAKMKMHPMKFENFNGRLHFEDEHLMIQEMSGKIGRSEFTVDLNYYLGDDESIKKRDNHFGIKAKRLDFDELFNYNKSPSQLAEKPEDHENVFNIYELPFTDMTIDLDIDDLNYHRYLFHNLHARLRTNPEHYIYVDTLKTDAAGGTIYLSGYFNGSDKEKIYFSPKMKLKGVDLDKLLFKFENFGQDHLVSENLHGKITADITGKIHMHADMIPILDDSEIHMDVLIVNGRLVNYKTLETLTPYFGDKNLDNVLFDTLQNHFDYTNGIINIPNMTINSSLGFMQIAGTQDMDMNMEYYVRVPLSLVAKAGWKGLFGKNEEEVDKDQVDEIEYLDPEKKVAFINIKIIGNIDDYQVKIGKDKRNKN